MRISNASLESMLGYKKNAIIEISAEHLAMMAAEILQHRGYRHSQPISKQDDYNTMLPESLIQFYQLLTRWRR